MRRKKRDAGNATTSRMRVIAESFLCDEITGVVQSFPNVKLLKMYCLDHLKLKQITAVFKVMSRVV